MKSFLINASMIKRYTPKAIFVIFPTESKLAGYGFWVSKSNVKQICNNRIEIKYNERSYYWMDYYVDDFSKCNNRSKMKLLGEEFNNIKY